MESLVVHPTFNALYKKYTWKQKMETKQDIIIVSHYYIIIFQLDIIIIIIVFLKITRNEECTLMMKRCCWFVLVLGCQKMIKREK